MDAFRTELDAVGGALDEWVSSKLAATAVDPTLVDDLSRAFPADALALIGSMVRADPSRRPSIDSLLEHPYVREGLASAGAPAGSDAAADTSTPRWLAELLDGGDDETCGVSAFYTSEERSLAVRVELQPPLGLLLEEETQTGANGGASLTVADVIDGAAAALSGKVRAGDRLVSVDGVSVRDASLESVMATLSRKAPAARPNLPPRRFNLGFERSCTTEECDVSGTDLDAGREGAAFARTGDEVAREAFSLGAAAAAGGGGGSVGVLDAGVSEWLGRRASQEDSQVLTSFVVAPRDAPASDSPSADSYYVLAACFDGHRGPQAATYGAAELPQAVRLAIEAGDPSPLAAAWRSVADGYSGTGMQDGACASAVLISGDGRCEFVNCGDCRAVLGAEEEEEAAGRSVVAFATRDHAAEDEIEMQRIDAMGGKLRCSTGGQMRVSVNSPSGLWQVAVARALGGSEWRGGGISDVADVRTLRLDESHRFLVLASDGIWGVLDECAGDDAAERSRGVALRVAAARAAGASAGDIAEGLVRCAEREGGTDNASCVVLLLGARG